VLDGRATPRTFSDKLSKYFNAYFFIRSYIDDFSHCSIRPYQAQHRLNAVLHITKATALVAGAEYCERKVCDCLPNQRRHDHSISASLPWPNRIEKPRDNDWQLPFFPIGQGEEFSNGL
jgi:hypothetical protein